MDVRFVERGKEQSVANVEEGNDKEWNQQVAQSPSLLFSIDRHDYGRDDDIQRIEEIIIIEAKPKDSEQYIDGQKNQNQCDNRSDSQSAGLLPTNDMVGENNQRTLPQNPRIDETHRHPSC